MRNSEILFSLLLLVLLGFFWIMVNIPSLFPLGSVYTVLTLLSLVFILSEEKISFIRVPSLMKGKLLNNLTYALLIVLFCLFFVIYPLKIPPWNLTVVFSLPTFILASILIPVSEEVFFSTLAFSFPTFYSLVMTPSLFTIFHFSVGYGSLSFLLYVFLFRVLATIAVKETGSLLPSLIAHSILNATACL